VLADALDDLRRDPLEWRRRGLTPPAALDALVHARVHGRPVADAAELAYADFFAS